MLKLPVLHSDRLHGFQLSMWTTKHCPLCYREEGGVLQLCPRMTMMLLHRYSTVDECCNSGTGSLLLAESLGGKKKTTIAVNTSKDWEAVILHLYFRIRLKMKKKINKKYVPENARITDMFWVQGSSLHELIAESVVKGAVQSGSTTVRMQDPKALQLLITVHKQLCFIPIDPHQYYIVQCIANIATD